MYIHSVSQIQGSFPGGMGTLGLEGLLPSIPSLMETGFMPMLAHILLPSPIFSKMPFALSSVIVIILFQGWFDPVQACIIKIVLPFSKT